MRLHVASSRVAGAPHTGACRTRARYAQPHGYLHAGVGGIGGAGAETEPGITGTIDTGLARNAPPQGMPGEGHELDAAMCTPAGVTVPTMVRSFCSGGRVVRFLMSGREQQTGVFAHLRVGEEMCDANVGAKGPERVLDFSDVLLKMSVFACFCGEHNLSTSPCERHVRAHKGACLVRQHIRVT